MILIHIFITISSNSVFSELEWSTRTLEGTPCCCCILSQPRGSQTSRPHWTQCAGATTPLQQSHNPHPTLPVLPFLALTPWAERWGESKQQTQVQKKGNEAYRPATTLRFCPHNLLGACSDGELKDHKSFWEMEWTTLAKLGCYWNKSENMLDTLPRPYLAQQTDLHRHEYHILFFKKWSLKFTFREQKTHL